MPALARNNDPSTSHQAAEEVEASGIAASQRHRCLLEVWKNGEKVLTRRGPNTYNDRKETYFKTGVYKWDWKSNPSRSVVDRRVLYVDEIRWGDRTSSYAEVAPRGERPTSPQ